MFKYGVCSEFICTFAAKFANIIIEKSVTMKKFLVMVAAAMMAATSVNAQEEPKHEVGLFYGFGSVSNIFSTYTSMFSAATGDQSSFFGPIGAEYYYHVSPSIGVGGVVEYAGCKAMDKNTNAKDLNESFLTIMPSVKFNWLRKKSVGLYSGVSAGVMLLSISCNDNAKQSDPDAKNETLVTFMFQATAIGLEVGGPFRAFVEAGIGEKGLLCAGLRYKF